MTCYSNDTSMDFLLAGHTDVMFIHAYYSQLLDLLSETNTEASTEPQTKSKQYDRYFLKISKIVGFSYDVSLQLWFGFRSTIGHLASAIISATVRDVLRTENVPVSVQYTLTTLTMVCNTDSLNVNHDLL